MFKLKRICVSFFGIVLLAHNLPSCIATTEWDQSSIPTYKNWASSFYYKPLVLVTPDSYDEIASVITNYDYPSPIKAMGNVHSVTECVVNEVGTQVDMTVFKDLWFPEDVRYDPETGKPTHVVAQSGVTLVEMHHWLAQYDMESMVSPEIGDATVGSITTSITKDAALNPDNTIAKGSFYELIDAVLYLDHEGQYIYLTRENNPEELAFFKSTDGLMGIILEVTVRVRKRELVTYMTSAVTNEDMLENYESWLEQGNLFMSITTNNAVIDRRVIAQPGQEHNSKLGTEIGQFARYVGFLYALHPKIADEASYMVQGLNKRLNFLNQTMYRYEYTNHYPAASTNSYRRLDFTWYEYPADRFVEIVSDYLVFLKDFKARHNGWEPTAGAAVYFVQRIPEKPFGWFSLKGEGFDQPGLSFTLDPANDNMHDFDTWQKFLKECNIFALNHGGRTALTQTRLIEPDQYFNSPGNLPIQEAPNQRFTSPFFARFRSTS